MKRTELTLRGRTFVLNLIVGDVLILFASHPQVYSFGEEIFL